MISVRAEMISLGIIKPAVVRGAPKNSPPVACPYCKRVLENMEQFAQHLKEVHAK